MVVGICGETRENAEILKDKIQHFFVNCKFNVYMPKDIEMDIADDYFKCDILIIYIKESVLIDVFINVGLCVNTENPMCQIIYIIDDIENIHRLYETKHIYSMLEKHINDAMPIACEKAKSHIESGKDGEVITLSSNGRKCYFYNDEIIYFERDGRSVNVVTSTGSFKVYKSLNNILEIVGENFGKINGGCVINFDRVSSGSGKEVYMDNGTRLEIGRTYEESVCKRISEKKE